MNFIGNLFIDGIFYGSLFFFFSVIFSYVDALGDFSKDAVMIFLIITYLTDTVFIFFFGSNTFQVNRMVVKGDLDMLLLKPVNSLFFISFRYVSTYALISICILLGLLLRVTYLYSSSIGLVNYVVFFISFILGILILYCVEFIIACLVFWYKNFSVGGWLASELTKYSRRPDSIYTGVFRKALFSFFPMALVSSLPARMLLFGPNLNLLLLQIFVTSVALCLTIFVWNRGLIRYDSASS
jgi:ABC-2 type transport system permease protein